MIETSYQLGSWVVYEPITVLTDLIIAVLCFLFWKRILPATPTNNAWRKFFFFFGWSTFVGAFPHALFPVHEGISYKSIWLSMQLLNGLAVFYAQSASSTSVLSSSPKAELYRKLILVQLLLFLVAVIVFQNFLVVVIDNALGLIPVMVFHFRKRKVSPGAATIGTGIAISFLTAIVHGAKISLHAYFNYNDLAHVFIMISLTVMYMGASKMSSFTPGS